MIPNTALNQNGLNDSTKIKADIKTPQFTKDQPSAYTQNVNLALDSVSQLIDQCYQAWQESRNTIFSEKYEKIENVVFCGMGGSSLPGHILTSIFNLKVPSYICEDYKLPNWADKHTLVLLSSYSGDTEETLSCAREAKEKKCLISGLATGGQLIDYFEQEKIPYYLINPQYNPSKIPRYGIGYGIFGELGILSNLKLISDLSDDDLDSQLSESIKHLTVSVDKINQSSQDLVTRSGARVMALISAGHLRGNTYVFANQINETAKNVSFYAHLPEADHNLIEAFQVDSGIVSVIFIESQSFHKRVLERFKITHDIIKENGFNTFYYNVSVGMPMLEMLEMLLFSSYFSVKLAQKNGVDPLSTPSVKIIKSKLALSPL